MDRIYLLVSMPEKFQDKFVNVISNLNAVNRESDGVTIEGQYGEKPEYVAIPQKK